MKSYSLAQIGRWRERTHRRSPRLRIGNSTQALKFVEEVGFCFMYKTGELDLPSLADALRPAPGACIDGSEKDPSGLWLIKGILPDETELFRGRLLMRRPMLLSLQYLPFFIALNKRRASSRRGESAMHSMGSTPRLILESLQRKPLQSTSDLRRRITLSARVGEGAFDVAMIQLQVSLMIGSITDDRKTSSRLWTTLQRLYPAQFRKAKRISVEEARRAILERHFRNQLVLTVADIRRLFRWERQEIFQTLGELIRRGIVTPEVQVDGITDRTYCLLT